MHLKRLLPFGVLLWAAAAQAGTREQNLCFFSLNNSREFELTRALLERENSPGGNQINVVEFHEPAQDAIPSSSFKRMIATNPTCDGLVISGHHTGSFGGARAKGVLDINFLEELSCDATYTDFFKKVKSVWLQGCRTLGVGAMESGSGDNVELHADYHMQRVGAELVYDGLQQSFADLSFEFSATLDQDNPLATRYLRVFPAANVYGWTKSSPGIKAGSERSLPYHMAHIAHLAAETPLLDPLQADSPMYTESMSQAFSNVLDGNPRYSPVALDAWLRHGQVRTSGLGFDNPDLTAYAPLLGSPDQGLLAAKGFGCDLRNSQTFHELQIALDEILSSPVYVAYNFNVIWDEFRKYRGEDTSQYAELRRQLAGSSALMHLLNKKLKSRQTGLLMKIEYYSFYTALTGHQVREAEALILEQARYFMLATDLAGTQYDIRDFRESLLQSLARNELADFAFYSELLRSPELPSDALYTLTWSLLKQPPQGSDKLKAQIVRHPNVDSGTLRGLAFWQLQHSTTQGIDILIAIVEHPEVDETTLGSVASVLAKYDIEQGDALITIIVAHPRAGGLALSQASLAIRKHKMDIERSLLLDILSHPAVDNSGLENVSRIIARDEAPGDSQLLEKIVTHEQVNEYTLSSVAIALGNHRFEEQQQLLEAIRSHPRANTRTLEYVERASAKKHYTDEDSEFL